MAHLLVSLCILGNLHDLLPCARLDLPELLSFSGTGHVEVMAANDSLGVPSLQGGTAYGLESGNVHGKKGVPENVVSELELRPHGPDQARVIHGENRERIGYKPAGEVFSDLHLAILPGLADLGLNVNHAIVQVDELAPFGMIGELVKFPVLARSQSSEEGQGEVGHQGPFLEAGNVIHEGFRLPQAQNVRNSPAHLELHNRGGGVVWKPAAL